MTAQLLDGKATAAAVRRELAERVAKLTATGARPPGLGTVLVGDDPSSRAYVGGKHRDCAQIGVASIRRELPADATQAQVEAVIDELNADPACTGYIVQLPLPRHLDAGAVLERMDPAKDADGLHPVSLGGSPSASKPRCPAPRAASSNCSAGTTCRSTEHGCV